MKRPVIFISAVSRELRTARDLVAKTLIALGYEPKWQDIAPAETGDLRAISLRARGSPPVPPMPSPSPYEASQGRMPRLAFGAGKDTIRNMKTPSRFPCFALLAAASLAFCFQAPLCAEEKPAKQLNKATAASSEAGILILKGKYAVAEQEHRAVLAIRERVLGAEHPDTLRIRNSLASALQIQGKYAEAEQEHRAVLAIQERVLGAEHPDTLKSRNRAALALGAQGKHAEAEKEHRALLAIQERVLGVEHPDVFQSCSNLALCLYFQKKLPEALAFIQRAETGYAKVPGPEHPFSKLTKGTRMLIEAAMRAK